MKQSTYQMKIGVLLQQAYDFDRHARICHNLACSEDHLLLTPPWRFLPRLRTAGFQRSFFVSDISLFQHIPIAMTQRNIEVSEDACLCVVG